MEPFQNTDNFTSARTYNHRQNGDTTGTTNDIDGSEYDDTNSGGFNMPAPVECTTQ
jgi:hypothetical protein